MNRGYIEGMASPPIQPIAALVPSASCYFETVAKPAIRRAIEAPNDASLAVSAFTLLYHLKDWARGDNLIADETTYWSTCPFAQMTAEIANGGKHMEVTDKRFTAAPSALEFRSCGRGEGGYGVGPYGVRNIHIKGHRSPADNARFYSVKQVLEEVETWWRSTLSL
jgi:hypothetical protein